MVGARRRSDRYSPAWAMPSGSGRRGARIHTSCAVVSAPTLEPRVRQVVLDGRVRQAQAVGGRLLRAGVEDRGAPENMEVAALAYLIGRV